MQARNRTQIHTVQPTQQYDEHRKHKTIEHIEESTFIMKAQLDAEAPKIKLSCQRIFDR